MYGRNQKVKVDVWVDLKETEKGQNLARLKKTLGCEFYMFPNTVYVNVLLELSDNLHYPFTSVGPTMTQSTFQRSHLSRLGYPSVGSHWTEGGSQSR